MKRLLAAAVKGSWEGDWQTAQGNERAVVTSPIGEGEMVWLEVEAVDEGSMVLHKLLLSADPLILRHLRLVRYRVVKDGSRAIEESATTVEMILANGTPST